MDKEYLKYLKELTDQLNDRDDEILSRLDNLTTQLHNLHFSIHNDLQVLSGTIYMEERNAMNGRTIRSLHNIDSVVLGIASRYNRPLGVIQMTETKILIVEDDPDIMQYLNLVMEDLGYMVVGNATQAGTAIKLAIEHDPDVVLMDIQLEGTMNGIDAACEITRHTGSPVIFMTGQTDVKMIEAAKKADPVGYLIKPFVIGQIYATIELARMRREKRK